MAENDLAVSSRDGGSSSKLLNRSQSVNLMVKGLVAAETIEGDFPKRRGPPEVISLLLHSKAKQLFNGVIRPSSAEHIDGRTPADQEGASR